MQTLQTSNQHKKKTKQYVDQNPVEAVRDLGRGIGGSASTLWEQFLGGTRATDKFSGDLIPGEELDLREQDVKQLPELPAIDYHREIRTSEVKIFQENQAELQQKIAQILAELKNLAKTSKELEGEFKQVAVETVPAKAGQYHLNFFEWFLSVIRKATLRANEAKSWLSVMYQKRAKRGYWKMFKKHGTTFGLSQERTVATQTG